MSVNISIVLTLFAAIVVARITGGINGCLSEKQNELWVIVDEFNYFCKRYPNLYQE